MRPREERLGEAGRTVRVKGGRIRSSDNARLRDLRGGCAFAPHVIEQCLLALRTGSRNRLRPRLGIGAAQLAFDTPKHDTPATWTVEEKPRDWQFTAEELRAVCGAIEYTPPRNAPDARLVLLEVSPRLAHAYWEISELRLAKLHMLYGDAFDKAVLVLRFYELEFFGATPTNQFDIDLAREAQSHTNHFWTAGKCYNAEIGFRLPDDTFVSVAQSNSIALPADAPRPHQVPEYLFVERHTKRAPAATALPQALAPLASADARATFEPIDDPCRDFHAERHVRDVYLRVLREGPRVLAQRDPIQPTPRETLASEYAERQAARRAAAASPATTSPKKAREERETAPCDLLVADLDSFAVEEWRSEQSPVTHSASLPEPRYEPSQYPLLCRREEAQATEHLPRTDVPADRALDLAHATIAAIHNEAIAPLTRRPCLPPPAPAAPREELADAPESQQDPFLAGLDIAPQPLPKRTWPRQHHKPSRNTEQARGAPRPFDAEGFSAGLSPLAKPAPEAETAPLPVESTAMGDLDLTVSLTLRGRAPAGTTLRLDNRTVPVQPDGTFELACELREGTLRLPLELHEPEPQSTRRRTEVTLELREVVEHSAWQHVRLVNPEPRA